MHLSPPVAKAAVRSKAEVLLLLIFFIVTPIVGVCNCSIRVWMGDLVFTIY